MTYEAVHAYPDGEATVARFAKTAAEYGFDGLVVRNHGDELPSDGVDANAVGEAYGVDVVEGVEVRASDPARASGFVGNHRHSKTVVLVHGGTPRINRFAVEQSAVDVLAQAAAENGVRLEFSLGRVLRATGGERVRALRGLRKLRELVAAFDVPYVVSAGPSSHLQLRAPRELVAVGEAVGFDAEQIARGLAEWRRLAERNRNRQSDAFVEPGVYRGSPGDGSSEGGPTDETDDERG